MSTLVFLEHNGDTIQKGALGVLSKAVSLDPDTAAVVIGSGVSGLAATAGALRRQARAGRRRRRPRGPAAPAARRRDQLARSRPGLRHRAVRGVGARVRHRRRRLGPPRRRAQLGPRRPRGRGRRTWSASAPRSATRSAPTSAGPPAPRSGWSAPARSSRSSRPARARSRTWPSRWRTSRPGAVMVEQAHEEQTGPSIEEADILVTGGRGLGAPEAFGSLEELAAALGGAVASTRAVVDSGWYPYPTQIGQTGKVVSPKVYLGFGVSGAIQHKVGMQTSQTIISVNKDANAPDLRVQRHGRGGRPAPDRPPAHGAREGAQGLVGDRLRARAAPRGAALARSSRIESSTSPRPAVRPRERGPQ